MPPSKVGQEPMNISCATARRPRPGVLICRSTFSRSISAIVKFDSFYHVRRADGSHMREAFEIIFVESQQMRDAMHFQARGNAGIVYLFADNRVHKDQSLPFGVDFGHVEDELKD